MTAIKLPTLPGPNEPYDMAIRLAEKMAESEQPLKHWVAEFYVYRQTHWEAFSNDEARALVYALLHGRQYAAGEGLRDWKPSSGNVSAIIDALRARVNDSRASTVQPDGAIPLANGWLIPQTRTLLPHTPVRFNLFSSGVAYDADAPRPEAWHTFLDQVLPDDDSQALLAEWFGYFLSGRTDLHKIMFIKGRPRSGKGTISEVLQSLVGAGGCAGLSMASFGADFGLQSMLGKGLAVVGDARMRTAKDDVTERLLSISGEDPVQINIKHKAPYSGKVPARIMLLSNEVPQLRDSAMALSSRLLLLETAQSFLGREDLTLRDRLLAELPGILLWALDGLERLAGRGAFTVPASAAALADEVRRTTSPVKAFIEDECTIGDDLTVETGVLYARYQSWCERAGIAAVSSQQFGGELRGLGEAIERSPQRKRAGRKFYEYLGVGLDG